MTRRVGVAAVLTVVLAVAAVWCLLLGVRVAPSTGGLLAGPVELTTLVGGWLVAGTAAGIAAVLVGIEAVSSARRETGRRPPWSAEGCCG